MKTPFLLSIVLLAPGCASMERSVLFGASVGGASGTGLGLLAEPSVGSALIGTGIGAIVGGAMGYLGHGHKQGAANPEARGATEDDKGPSLSKPEIRKVWQPPRVEGDRYIDGHHIYLLERPSVFTP